MFCFWGILDPLSILSSIQISLSRGFTNYKGEGVIRIRKLKKHWLTPKSMSEARWDAANGNRARVCFVAASIVYSQHIF